MQEMWEAGDRSLGWEDPLEEEMATHSSILAWEISRTVEPGGFQFMGSQRAGHDWAHHCRAGWIKAWNLAPALWLNKYLNKYHDRHHRHDHRLPPLILQVLVSSCGAGVSAKLRNLPTPLVPGKQALREHRVKDEHPGLAVDLEQFHIALSWQRKYGMLVDDYVGERTTRCYWVWYGHRVWRHLVFHVSGNIKVMRPYVKSCLTTETLKFFILFKS